MQLESDCVDAKLGRNCFISGKYVFDIDTQKGTY